MTNSAETESGPGAESGPESGTASDPESGPGPGIGPVGETVLIVEVPEAEPLVGPWRRTRPRRSVH